jgi:hypothetical protein
VRQVVEDDALLRRGFVLSKAKRNLALAHEEECKMVSVHDTCVMFGSSICWAGGRNERPLLEDGVAHC